MPEVIADTSALIAFFIRTEKHHNDARRYLEAHPKTRWVILESVFDEVVTWFRVKVSPRDAIVIGRLLREEHRYRNLSDDDDAATWEAFCRYDDKAWSYTDCSILVMAKRLGITDGSPSTSTSGRWQGWASYQYRPKCQRVHKRAMNPGDSERRPTRS